MPLNRNGQDRHIYTDEALIQLSHASRLYRDLRSTLETAAFVLESQAEHDTATEVRAMREDMLHHYKGLRTLVKYVAARQDGCVDDDDDQDQDHNDYSEWF